MNNTQRTCCFSGHRPGKLSFGYDEGHPHCLRLRASLLLEAENMRAGGVTTFLTGMAQGVDMFAAESVLAMKRAYPDDGIRLVAVIPFEGQADRWSPDYRERYFNILARSDDVITLHRHYTDDCMQERNRYLVDASGHLIAVYNGMGGGTGYTLDYAIEKGLDVIIINPLTLARKYIQPAVAAD